MGFDAVFFQELRSLSQAKIDLTRAKGIDSLVPHVGELLRDKNVSDGFFSETMNLVRSMLNTPYAFDTFFRAERAHIYDFPRGRAFKKQWNIAFTAGDTASDDFARIGIGFLLNPDFDQGIQDYYDFKSLVGKHPADFDRVFGAFGAYFESDSFNLVGSPPSLSASVVSDAPATLPEWRFFGKCLKYSLVADRGILLDTNRFAAEAVKVFDAIMSGGFY